MSEYAKRARALRAAFEDGAQWRWQTVASGPFTAAEQAQKEAARRWPITRSVPREPVKLPGNAGTVAPVDGKYVSFLPASYVEGSGAYFDAADLDAMRDLLENPTTTVSE